MVIFLSFRKWVDPDDPHKRKRSTDPPLPVGLKNTGNICYFNSLLQMYSNIPSVVKAVMAMDVSAANLDHPRAQNAVDFVRELQRCFAFLHLSMRRYLDPIKAVDALFKFNESSSESTKQHDVAEFNELVINTIYEAFKVAGYQPDFIRNTFYGHLTQEISAVQEDGTTYIQQAETDFSPIILDISSGNLLAAMDEYTQSTIDEYSLPSKFKTSARKSLWFHSFPEVLCFQLQRVSYDAAKGEARKINSRFTFDNSISIDRYLLSERTRATQCRMALAALQTERNEISQELGLYSSFGDSCSLSQGLGATIRFLKNGVDGLEVVGQGSERQQALNYIQQANRIVAAKVQSLTAALAAVEDKISHVFDDLDQHRYQLFAVLVHEGKSAGQGHYWTYVRPAAAYSIVKDEPQEEGAEEATRSRTVVHVRILKLCVTTIFLGT